MENCSVSRKMAHQYGRFSNVIIRDGGEISTRVCKKKKNKGRPSIFSLSRLAVRCASINYKLHYKDWNLSRSFSRTFSCVASQRVYTQCPLFACRHKLFLFPYKFPFLAPSLFFSLIPANIYLMMTAHV